MYQITFWNRNSTNFGKNSFVRLHGTESFNINIEANALACMVLAVKNPDIQSATMHGPTGCLSWTKNAPPTIPDTSDGYGYENEKRYYDGCDCDDCQGL